MEDLFLEKQVGSGSRKLECNGAAVPSKGAEAV